MRFPRAALFARGWEVRAALERTAPELALWNSGSGRGTGGRDAVVFLSPCRGLDRIAWTNGPKRNHSRSDIQDQV